MMSQGMKVASPVLMSYFATNFYDTGMYYCAQPLSPNNVFTGCLLIQLE